MSYPQSVSYNRDLDPDLRGNVDFNFFGDEEENKPHTPSDRLNDRQNDNNVEKMRKTSSSSASLGASSEYSDGNESSRSPVYQRSSKQHSGSESDDNGQQNKEKKHKKGNNFDAQSQLSTPTNSSMESLSPRSRSHTDLSHSSASSSRAGHKSSSSASDSPKQRASPVQVPANRLSSQPLNSPGASRSSTPPSSKRSSRPPSSDASSHSSKRRSSSVQERRSVSVFSNNKYPYDNRMPEEDGLSEVTEVSPLTSPEFVSPIHSPQTMRKKNKNDAYSHAENTRLIDFSTKPLSKNSRGIENNSMRESVNKLDEDKLDISLLLSTLNHLDSKHSPVYKIRGNSSRPAWVDPTSKNHTFSKLQSWEIEKENQRLLKTLLTGNKATIKKTKHGSLFPGGENVAQIRRPHHSTLNRQRQQRKIEIENQYILARIRSACPTPNMTRDHLLKSYAQQMQYGVPSNVKKPSVHHVITRDPVTYGLGGYRGVRGRHEDDLDLDTSLKQRGKRSNTHRGMGDDSSERQQEFRGINQRRPQSASVASRGSNPVHAPSSQNSVSSRRMASDRPPSSDRRNKTTHSRTSGSRSLSRALPNQEYGREESDPSIRSVSSRREWMKDW